LIQLNPRDPLPLWRQIEDGVRNLVAAEALVPGAAVPSVRELARELTVNPATIAKAYQRLCEAGVLEVRRGEGTFVAVGRPLLPLAERRRRVAEAARAFAAVATTLRVEPAVALELARRALDEMQRGGSDDGSGDGGAGR
jgi:GntR family transcriptional regulator